MLKFLKKHIKIVKALFIMLIFALVIYEFGRISHEFSYASLKAYLNSYGLGFFLALLAIGFISPLPMIGYDLSLMAYEGIEIDKKRLLSLSYMINAYNNMIGTGGILSLAFRYHFFAKDSLDRSEFTKKLTRITPYSISGISVLSIFALAYILVLRLFNFRIDLGLFSRHWIVLLFAGLYLVLIKFLSGHSKIKYLGGLPKKVQNQQVFVSLVEWIFLFTNFFLIGRMMGVRTRPIYLLALFLSASALGLISQIPAGLGSFDLVILTGLVSLGLDNELAASWLIFYRLSAYVIPFIIGTGILVNALAAEINEKYDQGPKRIFKEIMHKLNSALILVYGAYMILSILVPKYFSDIHWLRNYPLASWGFLVRFPSVVLGFIFVILARLSFNRQKKLLNLLVPFSIIGLIFQYANGSRSLALSPLIIILVLAFYTRELLTRDKFIYSWEDMTIDLAIGIIILARYMYNLGKLKLEHPVNRPVTGPLEFLIIGLSLFLAAFLIMKYFKSKDRVGKIPDMVEYTRFLEENGAYGSDTAGLSFLDDKYIYYYVNKEGKKTVAFHFSKINNKLVVLGGPFGKKEDFSQALDQFIKECDRLSYEPVFYEIDSQLTLELHDYGYDFIKSGERAIVDLEEFSLKGHSMASARNVLSRFERDGFSFSVEGPDHSEELIKEMKEISDIWLDGREEKGFSMGFFKEDYLARSDLALLRNKEGDLVAFANLIPYTNDDTIIVDLMRYDPAKAQNSTMDFLFLSLALYGQEAGKKYFDLGMAPLSMVGTMKTSYTSEKLAHLLYEYGNKIYSFKGLRKYKGKYATKWLPKYTSSAPGNWIIYTMLALILVDRKSSRPKKF